MNDLQLADDHRLSEGGTAAQEAPAVGASLKEVSAPPGMVLRYCGIEKLFFYARPEDPFCFCGHRIGTV